MKCDACKGEQLLVIRVRRYSKPVVVTGYALWILALLAAAGAGVILFQAGGATDDPAQRAMQIAVGRLEQIDAVTGEMIADFQSNGRIADSSLSKLGPEDRVEVDKIVADYRTGALGGAASADQGWVLWAIVLVACGAVFIIGVAMTLRKEKLRCAKCGAVIEIDEG